MKNCAWNTAMQRSSRMIWAQAFVEQGFFADEGVLIDFGSLFFSWRLLSLSTSLFACVSFCLLSLSASFTACAETLTALIFAWQKKQKTTLFFSIAGFFSSQLPLLGWICNSYHTKLFNWDLKLKILSAKKVSGNVAIDANKHLRSLIADRLTHVIGRTMKEWIVNVSMYIGVKHQIWANNRCLVYFPPSSLHCHPQLCTQQMEAVQEAIWVCWLGTKFSWQRSPQLAKATSWHCAD